MKDCRLKKGISQRKISELIGVSSSYYCQLENGRRRMSLPMAKKVAVALGASLDDLFMPGYSAAAREKQGIGGDMGEVPALSG